MSEIKIVDNFLHSFHKKELENKVMGDSNICWSFLRNFVFNDYETYAKFQANDENIITPTFGTFIHYMLDDNMPNPSKIYNLFENFPRLIESKFDVKIKKITRLRLNLVHPTGFLSDKYAAPHVDSFTQNEKIFIYYLSNSDGDTVLFNELHTLAEAQLDFNKKTILQRVDYKQGRAILFDAHRYHGMIFPSKKVRIIVNMNLILDN